MNFATCRRSYWQAMSQANSNSVVHLELHTGDLRGAVDFYARLFGWRPERIQAGAGSYLAIGMGDRVGGGVVECARGAAALASLRRGARRIDDDRPRGAALAATVLLSPREGPGGLAQRRLDA